MHVCDLAGVRINDEGGRLWVVVAGKDDVFALEDDERRGAWGGHDGGGGEKEGRRREGEIRGGGGEGHTVGARRPRSYLFLHTVIM